MAASASPRIDDVIAGRYVVERPLGEGGMATVYLARHTLTGRRVALKWVQAADPVLRQRLLREARAIARVSHPNVVGVLDAGEHRNAVFMVMDYLSGENLRSHVGRKPLPPEDAVRLLMPALEGVAAAHQAGILHRDLKPENLFVCIDADGHAFDTKVLDFGVAKTEDRETALTQAGHIVGTPEYMAPEQISHEPKLDVRTDVYALGVVLYELLAGRLPYATRDLKALLLDIVRGELPPPERFRPELPAPLSAVVMKALASLPDDRYGDIAAFAQALEPWAGGRGFRAPRRVITGENAGPTSDPSGTWHDSGAVPVSTPRGERGAPTSQGGRLRRERPPATVQAVPPAAAAAPEQRAGVAAARGGTERSRAPRLLALAAVAALLLLAALILLWPAKPRDPPPQDAQPQAAPAPPPKPAPAAVAAPATPIVAPAQPAPPLPPAEASAPVAKPAPAAVVAAPLEAAPKAAVKARSPRRAAATPAPVPAPAPATPVEVKARAGVFRAEDF